LLEGIASPFKSGRSVVVIAGRDRAALPWLTASLLTTMPLDGIDSSVSLFNENFSLPAASVSRSFPNGSNPGINGSELEALLDVEWGHAVAPGAAMTVYISISLVQAIGKAVADNTCGAISISYGFCDGTSAFYTGTLGPLFTQAAAQGQSVFASIDLPIHVGYSPTL